MPGLRSDTIWIQGSIGSCQLLVSLRFHDQHFVKRLIPSPTAGGQDLPAVDHHALLHSTRDAAEG